jgi:hypothetical protein
MEDEIGPHVPPGFVPAGDAAVQQQQQHMQQQQIAAQQQQQQNQHVAAQVAAQVAHQVANQAAVAVAQQAAHHVAQHAAQQAAQQAQQAAFQAVANANIQRELTKAYKPERFALRNKDTQAVQNFFYRIEKYFALLGVTDDPTKVLLATYAFDGHVATWWRSRFEGQAMTWAMLKAKVTERWCDENDVQRARNDLRNLRQTGSVASATSTFDNLCMRIPGITDEEKRDRYMNMLKPHVQKELLLTEGLDTYEKLASKAVLIDETLYRFRKMHMRDGNGSGSTDMELGHMGGSDDDSDEEGEGLNAIHGGKHHKHNGKRFQRNKKPSRPAKPAAPSPSGDSKPTKPGAAAVKCYNCGQRGHYAVDCDKPPRRKGNHPNGQAQA